MREEELVQGLADDLRIHHVPSKRKKVSKVFITIEGKIIIDKVNEIRDNIVQALNAYDQLKVTLENVTAIDAAGIQLLYYLSKDRESITIDSNFSDEIRKLISVAGFSEFLHKPRLN